MLVLQAAILLHGCMIFPGLGIHQSILAQLWGSDATLGMRVVAGALDENLVVGVAGELLVKTDEAEFSSFDLFDARDIWIDLVVVALDG